MKKLSLLIILITFFTGGSCMKKEDLDNYNLGHPIDADALQGKMGESIGFLSYYDIKRNEISNLTASSKIEDGRPNIRYKQNLKVEQVTDTPQSLVIDFVFDKQDMVNPDQSITNQAYQLNLTKTQNINLHYEELSQQLNNYQLNGDQLKNESPKPFLMHQAYIYFATQACRESKVTCHNLKTSSEQFRLHPDLAQGICSDINNCVVNAQTISFDMLDGNVTTPDGKPYRTHYTFEVIPELPFLSKVTSYCAKGLVRYGTRDVLVEDCMSVSSFSSGQN